MLLFALSLAVYAAALPVYFLSDDFAIIGKFIERHTFYFSFSDYFRPIPLLNLWLDTRVYGLSPALFRLENIALHAANAFLVYRLALLILGSAQSRAARISGILFAVLACHSEAVIWISCRPDLLATLFSLLCLINYLNWLRSGQHRFLFISVLAFLLAFLCKESAFALPLLLLAMQAFHEVPLATLKNIRKYGLAILLFSTGLVIQFVLRYIATGSLLGGEESIVKTSASYFYNLFAYSYRTLLFPFSTANYATYISANVEVISIIAVLSGFLILRNINKQTRRVVLFMLLAFILALLPVLDRTISLYNLQMERYVYLPSVFICIFMAALFSIIPQKRLQYTLIGLYAVVSIACLGSNISRWNKASTIALNSLREVKEHFHAEKLLVLGLPSTYQGVGIFKNGFPRAVMFFNEVPIRRKNIYLPVILDINDEKINLDVAQDANSFYVSLNAAHSTLTMGEKLAAYNLQKYQDNGIVVQYADIRNKDYQIMLYCDEQLKFAGNCMTSPE